MSRPMTTLEAQEREASRVQGSDRPSDPEFYPTRHVTRRCPECGGWNGSHTSALCPNWED